MLRMLLKRELLKTVVLKVVLLVAFYSLSNLFDIFSAVWQ